ncbi:hypothetical protein [Alicyclobacillus mali (ex Roth et al. 2021)]|uniref:hypothetical protein n=1 Tax=Alicyclobacillus mali (ex Roth et al. 2021) TaxID=1123961 RepID=UPI001A904AD0|nr:hypothetical protein [Alicyclobacillus mali (ex Roth et al. 2021)]
MSKQDPTYFGSLQSAIYSGNPELIDTAFAKGSRLVADSIKSLKMQTSKTTIQDNAVGECIWFAAGYAVAAYTVAGAVNYAVVVNAAGGINAYAVVFVKQWFWPSAVQDSANNELAKEEMIQQMVNTFHS